MLNWVYVMILVATGHVCHGDNDTHCADPPRPVPCLFGECEHGVCYNKTIVHQGTSYSSEMCRCFEGWAGFYCDRCCSLDCPKGEVCFEANIFSPLVCEKGTYANFTETGTFDNFTDTGTFENVTDTIPSNKTVVEPTALITHWDEPVPCFWGECEHGVCYNKTTVHQGTSYSSEMCRCYEGWAGFYCDRQCTLDCPPGQVCYEVNLFEPPVCKNGTYANRTDTGIFANFTDSGTFANFTNSGTFDNLTDAIPSDKTVVEPTVTNTHCDEPVPCLWGECEHGVCYNMTTVHQGTTYSSEMCRCFEGWTGFYCDRQCTLDCPPGQACYEVNLFKAPVCKNGTYANRTVTGSFTNATAHPCKSNVTNQNVTHPNCSAATRPEISYCDREQHHCFNGDCNTEIKDTHVSFSCECDEGWSGPHCGWCCDLPCVRGFCSALSPNVSICSCPQGYTGKLCDEKIKIPTRVPVWAWCVIGVAIAALITTVIVVYIMWRRRSILILKVVRYIHAKRYPDSEDDGKLFDGCISCAEADEEFVWNQLIPTLEKELRFSVWLKGRDFNPGEATAENMLWAVERSRRTIMVISPAYMEEEWPLFHAQVAHLEMLHNRHELIPVIIADTSHVDDVNPLIRVIMQTWKCVKWPSDQDNDKKMARFWKRLELAMPDKSQTDEKSTSGLTSVMKKYLKWSPRHGNITQKEDEKPSERFTPLDT